MSAKLKLRAEDAEDIAVIATCLQDALVQVSDIAYLPEERRFVMVANRFCWEDCGQPDGSALFSRVHCGVVFDGVARVRRFVDCGVLVFVPCRTEHAKPVIRRPVPPLVSLTHPV